MCVGLTPMPAARTLGFLAFFVHVSLVVHPSIMDRLVKRYFGKLSFRADPALHAEAFKIFNAVTNEELASVGG